MPRWRLEPGAGYAKGSGRTHDIYSDRHDAGQRLAEQLAEYAGRQDVIVLGLPRGGVPVAQAIAAALDAPLDIVAVRKLGIPDQPEVAFGAVAAIADSVETVYNPEIRAAAEYSYRGSTALDKVKERELAELARRATAYRSGRPPLDLAGMTAILVDDGLATGATMRAAVTVVRTAGPARVVVAVPVGSVEACGALKRLADEVICPWIPPDFRAVGQAYIDFDQVSDAEVEAVLSGSS